MTYYKIIDGEKYDKGLLDLADELSQGRGDGRISTADLKQVTEAAYDGASLTDIERSTLRYIVKNYQVTEAAKDWLEQRGPVVIDDREFRHDVYRLLAQYQIDYTDIKINPRDVESMHRNLPTTVGFLEALKSAVEIFLSDTKRNAPLYEVDNITSIYLGIDQRDLKDESKWAGVVLGLLKERINEGYLSLLPVWEDLSEAERGDLDLPDIDVSSKDSWIFFLGIRTDDHQFFAIVDRKGEKPTYIYGYN